MKGKKGNTYATQDSRGVGKIEKSREGEYLKKQAG